MSAEPVDPWTGHSHPYVEGSDCPSDCPKYEPDPPPEPEPEKPAKKAPRRAPRPRGDNRASGLPAASEEAVKQADDATEPPDERVLPEEREEWFRAPGFQRMKTAWDGKDKQQMDRVEAQVNRVVYETFIEAYAIMSDIYDVVREQEVDEATGVLKVDPYGFKIWKRHPLTQQYIEDWSLLSLPQREDFLFRILTQLFEWEQRAGDLWTRAMFSKGMFVEKFAIEYDKPIAGTIDDRNARGNVEAAEDRYFALMNAAISRKADALVRTMTRLEQRLKDTMSQ